MVSAGIESAGKNLILHLEVSPPLRYTITIRQDGPDLVCTTDRHGAVRVPGVAGGLVSLLVQAEPNGAGGKNGDRGAVSEPFRTAWVRL